jgi:hypothetical protein
MSFRLSISRAAPRGASAASVSKGALAGCVTNFAFEERRQRKGHSMPERDTQDLAARKSAVIGRLETLHMKRGAAALDGGRFDSRRIARVEAELAALGEAEIVALRRRRAAAQASQDANRTTQRQEIEAAEAQRLAAVARAERACRDMIAAMKDAKEAAEQIRTAATKMGRPAPLVLMPPAVEARLSDRLMVLLGSIAARPGWFGHVVLRRPFAQHAADDWSAVERRATATDIAVLLGKPVGADSAPASGDAAADAGA